MPTWFLLGAGSTGFFGFASLAMIALGIAMERRPQPEGALARAGTRTAIAIVAVLTAMLFAASLLLWISWAAETHAHPIAGD